MGDDSDELPRHWGDLDRDAISRILAKGLTPAEVGALYGRSGDSVRALVRRWGLDSRALRARALGLAVKHPQVAAEFVKVVDGAPLLYGPEDLLAGSGRARTAGAPGMRVLSNFTGIPEGAAVHAATGGALGFAAAWPSRTGEFADKMDAHPDGKIFRSFPRAGTINAAQILAEWGDARAAFDHPDSVAALAGICPVTKASGRQRGVAFRWACNKRLRQAITTFADNSRHASPWAADIYNQARASGKDHPHAVRILARAWVRIMWRCWQNNTPYDPALHGGAQHPNNTPAAA